MPIITERKIWLQAATPGSICLRGRQDVAQRLLVVIRLVQLLLIYSAYEELVLNNGTCGLHMAPWSAVGTFADKVENLVRRSMTGTAHVVPAHDQLYQSPLERQWEADQHLGVRANTSCIAETDLLELRNPHVKLRTWNTEEAMRIRAIPLEATEKLKAVTRHR